VRSHLPLHGTDEILPAIRVVSVDAFFQLPSDWNSSLSHPLYAPSLTSLPAPRLPFLSALFPSTLYTLDGQYVRLEF
jgi:hypothetical protein